MFRTSVVKALAVSLATIALAVVPVTTAGALTARGAPPSGWAPCPSSKPGPPYGVIVKGVVGTCVHYSAQVYQFDSVTGAKAMLVAITNHGFGVWNNLVYVRLANASMGTRIFDRNVVVVVGRLAGTYSYTNTLGGTDTVPAIDATELRLASSKTTPKPAILSFTAAPAHVPASGGSVDLRAVVRNATSCRLAGQLTRAVGCASGRIAVVDDVGPNGTGKPRVLSVVLTVEGKGGIARRTLSFLEAAKRAPTPATTTTTSPPTTTTTAPPPPTTCAGPCRFVFPQSTLSGVVSVTLNALTQGVACPDPGVCDATSGQQIDDVNVTVCAGAMGDSDVSSQIGNFSLALSDGAQASNDSVSFDSSVLTAFGNYGAVAPNQCVTGDMYFDAPAASQWTSLNYSYTSANFNIQTVYSWSA